MKTKKMQNILKFVDKNLKFKSEFRGKRRTSKTIKYKSKKSSSRRSKNKKMENVSSSSSSSSAMVKDILYNNLNNNSDCPVNDVIINAFNTFARLCVSHFKFKDTMDNIQGDYKGMVLGDKSGPESGVDTMEGWSIDEANKLFMKQVDKKVITMDNFVTKTSPPQDEMILPKTKELNLKDPKYKRKDIKKGFTKNNIGNNNNNGVKWGDTNEVIDVKVTKSENSNITGVNIFME